MKKNILMVLDEEFPPDDRVYKEAQSLIKEGFNVSIACYTFTNKPEFEEFEGINIFRKKIPTFIYKSSIAILKIPIYFNWWRKYIENVLSKKDFQIIHIHDLPLTKIGVYFKQKHKLKLVVDLHENWPAVLEKAKHINTFWGKLLSSHKQWREYEGDILKHADLIITVVDEMKERLKLLGINNEISVLENTINLDNFTSLKLQKNEQDKNFKLIFAGALNVERGLQYVIKGLNLIKQKIPNLKLIIIGNGSYKKHLEKLIVQHKLEDVVEFLGWKPLNELLSIIYQADINLIPHLKWEQTDCSSPNKLFQYMFVKTPLLVSNCNSIARIVNNTKSGLSYKYNDYKEFAGLVEFLYKNPDKRKEMGENGKQAVLTKYNWSITVQDFLIKYKSL